MNRRQKTDIVGISLFWLVLTLASIVIAIQKGIAA